MRGWSCLFCREVRYTIVFSPCCLQWPHGNHCCGLRVGPLAFVDSFAPKPPPRVRLPQHRLSICPPHTSAAAPPPTAAAAPQLLSKAPTPAILWNSRGNHATGDTRKPLDSSRLLESISQLRMRLTASFRSISALSV